MEMVGGNSCGRARRLSMAISESGLIKKSMRNCEKKIEENNFRQVLCAMSAGSKQFAATL